MAEPTTTSEPIADLPTGEPIPSSAAPPPSSSSPPSSKPPSPLLPPLRALLAAAPANIDAFLAHLHRCLQTPSGIDTLLLFVCYTSRFSSAALSSLSQSLLRRSARELVALAFSLPPRTTVLFSVPGKTSPGKSAAAELALLLAARLKSLAGLTSELRMMMRLWGLLGMYFWGKGLAKKLVAARRAAKATGTDGEKAEGASTVENKESPLVTAVAWTQWLSCVVFQALENGAYLSSKGVLGWSPETQARAYRLGTKAWGVYVAVELGRLAAEIVARRKGRVAANEEAEKAQTEEVVALRTEFVRNAAWAPLILHWSSDKGLVSDMTVGLLGSVPGVIQIRKLWKSTA